ncbi:MAG: hypothetical protein JWN98_2134 [Abditibacteriota bacterium]|nr:hypothetical protein [Abditibacteriota bacterium]
MGFVLCGSVALKADFTGSSHLVPLDEGAIQYSNANSYGPIEKLQERIDNGTTRLKHEPKHGYLLSLLDQLKVLQSSQMLVFSKTSLQRDLISPKTPRALYFNDDVYVGYIPNAPLLEISVADPKLGAVFYTIEQTKQDKPRLVRTNQCLECHASSKSMGVPGHLVRSFTTDEMGMVDFRSGTDLVTHRTPLAERWGGWYVTGAHGKQSHLGNLAGEAAFKRHAKEPSWGGNVTNLASRLDASRYPVTHSDIVALMVLEHQTHMHNFLTRLNYEATLRIARYGEVKYLDSPVEAFLKYLLFTEEAPLTAPISGTSRFTQEFSAQGPKDQQGRSLRDFDLKTRLFKYQCSFLIYSAAFEGLPGALKEKIYRRLWEVLSGQDTKPQFAKLSPTNRRAIIEILAATKTDLPAYWKSESSPTAPAPAAKVL